MHVISVLHKIIGVITKILSVWLLGFLHTFSWVISIRQGHIVTSKIRSPLSKMRRWQEVVREKK